MNLEALRSYRIRPIEHAFTTKDTILYALGLGYGADPVDPGQLTFVYEDGLKAIPSLCNVLAHPGFWVKDPVLELDWVKLLHGEQAFEIHRPLPAAGHVRGEYEIVAVEDKGDKGAVMYLEKRLSETVTGEPLATVRSTYMLRGDGGQGGYGAVPASAEALPQGDPDMVIDIPTLPQSALIYRLSGDLNPIHADPAAASKAGFARPILQGLCSMGLATRAIVSGIADNRPERLASLSLRFSRPVFPGETIRTEIFRQGNGARFRARAVDRDVVILDRGTATLCG